MPELPEVETVALGLRTLLGSQARIREVALARRDLRTAIPEEIPIVLRGRRITAIRRRAKYLLIDCDGPIVLNHLGMTGVWRIAPVGDDRTHDHVTIHLDDGRRLVFNDARRFGMLGLCREDGGHAALDDLGPEPLEWDFTVESLAEACRRRARSALKAVIMDQAVVVGVGNIYAAEALFRSAILPTRAAGRVSRARLGTLVAAIRSVLSEAIIQGGSSIDDFRHVNGLSGRFQHSFAVYGRQGKPCRICQATLLGAVVSGRATVWCPRCQR